MFRVALLGICLALITVIPSHSRVLGSQWPPSDATQFSENRTRCVAHCHDVIHEGRNGSRSVMLLCFSKCYRGRKCRSTVDEVNDPKMQIYPHLHYHNKEANVVTSACLNAREITFLLSTSLPGNDATVFALGSVESEIIKRTQRLLAHTLDSDVIGTGTRFGIFNTSAQAITLASNWIFTISGICVILIFPLFLLVATCVLHKSHRFARNEFGCSSSKTNKIGRFVLPLKSHQYLFIMAFLLVNMVPKTVWAQGTCDEDCGGHSWFCNPSSCFIASDNLPGRHSYSNWSEAVKICSREGAALLSFQDEEEENDFTARFTSHSDFFFGLVRRPTSATGVYSYQWSDGSPLTYARWNQLGTFSNEKSCGKLVFFDRDSTMHWRSQSCSSRLQFICKKPRNPTRRDGDVRLFGGVLPTRGRLEIFHRGFWKGVCMNRVIYSASRTAAASCRRLGYSSLLEASSRVGESNTVSIDINCTSNDKFIRSCDRGKATCNEHLFVFCRPSSIKPFDVRLGDSSVSGRGIAEIHYGGEWRAACLFSPDDRDENLLKRLSETSCKHLGYGEGAFTLQPLVGRSRYWNVSCYPRKCDSIRSIQDFHFVARANRVGAYGIEVTCRNSDWNIRLVNGFGETKQSEGRVEVFLDKTWRVVCDRKWNLNDSIVVCRQLGYGQPISAKRRFSSTRKDEMIYTNGRRCKGNETTLKDCDLQIKQPNESCQEAVVLCKERKYCPRGWFLYAGYCYTFTRNEEWQFSHRWDLNDLRSCGGNLLSISSSHEHSFVLALLADFESRGERFGNDLWIGLNRIEGNQFKWVNQDMLSYVMWARGEPSADSSRKCVAMDSRTGYWRTADCFSLKRKLCKVALGDFDNRIRKTDPPAFDNRCAKDEIFFKKACYYLSKGEDTPVSQKRAHRKMCRKRNAHLAIFSDVSEHFFIAKESSALSGSAYWIGLIYNDTSNIFTWLHGIPAAFTKWAKYEPAREKGRCVTFGFDGVTLGWAVAGCSTKAGYICKRELNATTVSLKAPYKIFPGHVFMCRSDWTKLGMKSCFKRLDTLMTWHESLAECERLSDGQGSLASIHSLQEMDRLFNLLDGNETWIGLNDIDNEGIYNWTDGSPLVYANWNLSESEETFWQRQERDCIAATKSLWQSRHCLARKKGACLMPAFEDFDECSNKTHNCHGSALCTNTQSSYKCICKQGFIGSGTMCEDVNECLSSPCSKDDQECVNVLGSFLCVCANGWTGNGNHCNDINECNFSNICHSQANCTNTNGSFECTCKYGFRGDGNFCEAIMNAQNLSKSELSIIVSVTCSLVALVLLIVVYVYLKKHYSAETETADDSWEIDPRGLTLLEKIGEGFFGDVLKAEFSSNFPQQLKLGSAIRPDAGDKGKKMVVACKKLKGTYLQQDEADFLEEIKLMKGIGRHPHIVCMLACVTKSQPFCLIVEYCCHGDLLSYIRNRRPKRLRKSDFRESDTEDIFQGSNSGNPEEESFCEESLSSTLRKRDDISTNSSYNEEDKVEDRGEKDAWEMTASDLMSFAWQIASGMEYLAGKHLVHRDLACRNVLVCKSNLAKVSDFGLTRAVYEDGAYRQKTARRLPLRWMSVEAIIHRLFTEKSDVWSFGVVLWEIFTLGCFPYPCMTSRDILLRLRRGDRLDCPESCSEELGKLMSECWLAEAGKRPTFEQLSQRLGKMLEEESSNKYLNLDITYLYPFWDMKSKTETNSSISASSECFDGVFQFDCATPKEPTGDRVDVRHAIRRESTV